VPRLIGSRYRMQMTNGPAAAEARRTSRDMKLSLRWAEEQQAAVETAPAGHADSAIEQGATCRNSGQSARAALVEIGFSRHCTSAASRSENRRRDACDDRGKSRPILHGDRPRELMGVGTPESSRGGGRRIDMFDCVMQTRTGPPGIAFHPIRGPDQSAATPATRRSPSAREKPGAVDAGLFPARLSCITWCEVWRELGAMLLSEINIA